MPKIGQSTGYFDESTATIEEEPGKNGKLQKFLFIRKSPIDPKPFKIGFTLARLIIRHFDEIKAYVEKHGYR